MPQHCPKQTYKFYPTGKKPVVRFLNAQVGIRNVAWCSSELDINHFVIDLYDNTWLAKAQHVWQGTAVLEDGDMGLGNALKSLGCPLPRDLHGASTSTAAVGKAFSTQLDQPLLAASNKI